MIDLKKAYGKRFRTTIDESFEIGDRSNEEKLWNLRIPGKYGHIGVWGPGTLSVFCDRPMVIKRLKEISGIQWRQNGDRECQGTFHPDLIDEVAGVIKARKRRTVTMTDEQKDELRARLVAARSRIPGSDPGVDAQNRSEST
jgi:hypothetical protein